jgi:hypothetical protein
MRSLLWEASSANTSCPQAMQDGASRLLQRQLELKKDLDPVERKVFENAFAHLTSRDPRRAWTSGQVCISGTIMYSSSKSADVYIPAPETCLTSRPVSGVRG